ncbi:MAG TPA: PaaI family thioesterase [Crocinitomicaceae bacterium]|nr:PaaI family thioesterase [Crocinitomicaceae bacterium]
MKDLLNHPIVLGYKEANNFGRELGMEFRIVSHGEVEYKMTITEKHLATPIAAHGGSISALMDATMGVCALSEVIRENKVVSTLEMKLSFISPGLLGDTMIATAKIIKNGKRILFVEGNIRNQENKLIATASGTFNAYPASKAGFKDLKI